MKSSKAGKTISDSNTEITNVSPHGIWLFHEGKEYFLPYVSFPWFRKATIEAILNLEVPGPNHFYWPGLDVDLHLDTIKNPEKYPLISQS
jgi:hypothetical protein